MIRGFVEQQQVRRRHQRLRQMEADAPAARERAMRLGFVLLAEAEAAQNRAGAGLGVVAAGVLVVGIEVAEGIVVPFPLGLGDGAFHAAQSPVAVEHEIDCAAPRRLHVLIQRCEAP